MKATEKAPEIDLMLEVIFGINRINTIESDTCICCRKEATDFKDELSRKEYSISGLCQQCQDRIFK